jgi:hypothetical protein
MREKSDRPGNGRTACAGYPPGNRRKWSSEEKIRIVLSAVDSNFTDAESRILKSYAAKLVTARNKGGGVSWR